MAIDDPPPAPPLIAAAEQADRRNLTIIGVVSVLVIGWILLWAGDDGSSEEGTTPPLSAHIELTAQTVASGGEVEGRVVVLNNTGRAIEAIGCGSLFQIALENEDVSQELNWNSCREVFVLPAGQSSYPVTVYAHHLGCVRGPASGTIVSCDDDGGMPSLPPGDYEAVAVELSGVLPQAPPVHVVVSDS